MIKTIYKCDCCGKEWDAESKDETICTVSINVWFNRTSGVPRHNPGAQQWCRTCVISKGIRDPCSEKDKKIAPEKPLSFEEKFVELLNEIGFYQGES